MNITGMAAKLAAPTVLTLVTLTAIAESGARTENITVAAARDALFADERDRTNTENSRESLFGNDTSEAKNVGKGVGNSTPSLWRGFVQSEAARTITGGTHWTKFLNRAELGRQGAFSENVKWKLSARLDYDAVYDLTNRYPSQVRDDQRLNFTLRENYLDIGAGNWDFRVGRQHVVWGEMVGLYFADVVSAKDMREFILPEFDVSRIPQWGARAEYSGDAFHAELLWIPVASYDEIGKPGADFFPAAPPPPGFASLYRNEVRPARSLDNTNYGLRLSTLQNGWDVAGFYYRSMDSAPTFYREIIAAPQPVAVYEARHDRISQLGGTVAKDLGPAVFKAEAVYTRGRKFNVLRPSEPTGVVAQNTVDWAAGLDFTLPADTRLNLQVFQRVFFDHDPDIVPRQRESGYSVLLNRKLTDNLEAQALWISSFNRRDWLLRPRLAWNLEKNWRLLVGVDIFKGPPLGLFGRYDQQDRVYGELRYSF